jgi:hypothetical protein
VIDEVSPSEDDRFAEDVLHGRQGEREHYFSRWKLQCPSFNLAIHERQSWDANQGKPNLKHIVSLANYGEGR